MKRILEIICYIVDIICYIKDEETDTHNLIVAYSSKMEQNLSRLENSCNND